MPLLKPQSSEKQALSSEKPLILLVDDNKMGLAARRSVVQELGFRALTTNCTEEALELFQSNDVALVVTDYKMPRMNGRQLIERMRAIKESVPVILISGFVDTLGLNEQNTGANVVIMKSANEVSHFLRALKRLLPPAAARKPADSQHIAPKAKKKSV